MMCWAPWRNCVQPLDPAEKAGVREEMSALQVQGAYYWSTATLIMTAFMASALFYRFMPHASPMWLVLAGVLFGYALCVLLLQLLYLPSRRYALLLTLLGSLGLSVCLAWSALDLQSSREIEGREELRVVLQQQYGFAVPPLTDHALPNEDRLIKLLGSVPMEFFKFIILNAIQCSLLARSSPVAISIMLAAINGLIPLFMLVVDQRPIHVEVVALARVCHG